MRRRANHSIAFALLACFPGFAPAADSYSRDWALYPPVIERPAPAALYAIGDIHGDYQRLLRLLVGAHIVPAAPTRPGDIKWSAGTATLVVTGDMIDKGPRPVDVLRLMIALRAAARQSQGEVILLAGNHEAEFLAGPDAKKAADFIADLKKSGYSPAQIAACQNDLGAFLCTLPFAARIGDWFFSHAGNTDGRTLGQIAADILFLIDVGMSEGVNDSQGAALRIANGKAAAICPDGAETVLWEAIANTDTGRAAPCKR